MNDSILACCYKNVTLSWVLSLEKERSCHNYGRVPAYSTRPFQRVELSGLAYPPIGGYSLPNFVRQMPQNSHYFEVDPVAGRGKILLIIASIPQLILIICSCNIIFISFFVILCISESAFECPVNDDSSSPETRYPFISHLCQPVVQGIQYGW